MDNAMSDALERTVRREAPRLSDATQGEFLEELRRRLIAQTSVEEMFMAIKAKGANLDDIVFDTFAQVSQARTVRWTPAGVRDLTILERAAEMGGEAGEVLNVAKKLLRHELGMVGNFKPGDTSEAELKEKLETEMGDVLVCLLNLQNKAGVNLLRGFRRAFNEKSEQLGFPERV